MSNQFLIRLMLFLVTLYQILMLISMLTYAQSAHAWNVPFSPSAPEIAASSDGENVLKTINILINWGCAIISAYVAFKAAGKLHDSDIRGFFLTMTGAFIIGGAPYFSQYFLFN
jgi:hypothetical protein